MPRSPGDPRGWTSLDQYLTTLDAQLRRLGNYFVERSDLSITATGEHRFQLRGRIYCQYGLFVDVTEVLVIDDLHRVRCTRYKYHAGFAGEVSRSVFRYDNAHVYAREGHQDAYHKHRFNYSTWEEIAPPIWIGRDDWPTLAEVIDELYDWWQEVGRFLQLE